MSREILFRGKTKDGRWVYGDLVRRLVETTWQDILGEYQFAIAGQGEREKTVDFKNKRAEVISCTTVNPTTVGQFTGLVDKNGTKIFEGDLLTPPDDEIDKAVVEFSNGAFRVSTYGYGIGAMTEHGWDEDIREYGLDESEPIEEYGVNNVEVIGNIHDTQNNGKKECSEQEEELSK